LDSPRGYARSTGKVPLVSLLIDNGMSNGLSLMIDQLYSGTPMVMTAGNKDIHKLAPGRSDLANMARPYAKWSTEITQAEQVPAVIRRAFQEARTVPTGPVFVAMSDC
jgi:benzoylformate decarboxylase